MIFGIFFLLIGILGFVPAATPGGHLLGIFHVNIWHNLIHIASGIIALICGMAGAGASKKYLQLFGIIYAIIAILGAMNPEAPILGVVSHNMADLILHIVIAVVALAIGFGSKK